MTSESLEKGKRNRDLHERKTKSLDRVEAILHSLSDNDYKDVWIGSTSVRFTVYPTEVRTLLILMEARLKREIHDLDEEFKSL